MERPIRCKQIPEHNTVKLFFPDEREDEYYVKGSIVWPEKFYHGFALIVAQDLINSCVWIFEQYPFLGVDYQVQVKDAEDRVIDVKDCGLIHFFNDAKKRYACNNFFYYGDQAIHKYWRKLVYRELLIERPAPRFIKVKQPEQSEGQDNLIISYSRRGKLKIDRDSPLFNQLESINDPEDLENKIYTFPESAQSIRALRAVLLGLEKMPWRMPPGQETEKL